VILADAPCKFCGVEPNRVDDEFCSDECATQWAEQLFFTQPEEPQERLRPRVVLLKVIQSDDEVAEDLTILTEFPRPHTRSGCLNDGPNAQRPCPYVGCSMHLYLDVLENGAIRYNFPGKEVDELEETCALDVAVGGAVNEDQGEGITLEQIGHHMNVTRERVRQLIEQAIKAGKAATNPLYKSSIDVEDPRQMPDLRHPLEDITE
jgi:sigma-70-like protein